jgi:hypothetical protein
MHYNVFFQSFRWFLPRARILRKHDYSPISRITGDGNSSQSNGTSSHAVLCDKSMHLYSDDLATDTQAQPTA